MIKAFEKYAKRMDSDWSQAFVRRVMWIDMDERIKKVYSEVEHSEFASRYGNLYLHEGLSLEAKKIHTTQKLNQIQLSCGMRLLGLKGIDVDDGRTKLKINMEIEAALWFTQSPSGGVTVFMSPYKSDVLKMNEDDIIIGHYKDPSKLTVQKIRRLFTIFFRYLSITSAMHHQTVFDYGWRLWLIFLDIRSRKYKKILGWVVGITIFTGALVTCIAFFNAAQGPKAPDTQQANSQHHLAPQESSK
ncbi:hypothetical protein [Pseudomonas lurida]|uniref:hypothetical protein n=1 Tax=Pseudomonas lurida TaxID=244566 RepID=UPI00273566BE|nr:hypothetical protein [Pseudomonas lurida]WLG30171.1 hypothetical protein PSH68_08260 [Pseudomonas lurida]